MASDANDNNHYLPGVHLPGRTAVAVDYHLPGHCFAGAGNIARQVRKTNQKKMIDKLNEWIRTRRQYIESERAPGTTYGDTDHDQTAVHFGQLELLDDLQLYVGRLKEIERLRRRAGSIHP